jgi:hypothetical protein
MADKNLDYVMEAAARNVAAVISLPSAGMLRNHKSRFIAELEGGILFEAPAGEDALIGELIRQQTPCAVSFRNGALKVMFASRIRRTEKGWKLNEHATVDVILLDVPTEVKASQKRSNYRVEVQPDSGISVRVWRLGPAEYFKPQPSATKEVKAEIRNISTGGVGVKFIGKDGAMPVVGPEDRLRVELKANEQTLVVEGQMRAATIPPKDGAVVTGIQFKKLENSMEGRHTSAQLVKIVGDLQRDELRMIRMGLIRSA